MSEPVVLLVSVWLKSNDVPGFEAFERKIAAIQARHGGRIERTVRLGAAPGGDVPFEVHIVHFPDAASLAAYRSDNAMKELAEERQKLIARTQVVEGRDVEPYRPAQ